MLSKSCPHCKASISIAALREQNRLKTYLNRQPIPCPHCQQWIQLPAFAEKLISIGLLFCVILAPLTFYWLGQLDAWSLLSFCLGILLLLTGISQNQPRALCSQQENMASTNNTRDISDDEK